MADPSSPAPPEPAGRPRPAEAVVATLVELLGRRPRSLDAYYACGRCITDLRPADAGYGSGWVRTLCEQLDRRGARLSPSLAYRLVRFADAFPGKRGEARVRKLNGRVTWEVVMRALHVPDATDRDEILRRAADEGLASRAAMALIRETTAYRRPRGGRPPARPSSHPYRALRDLGWLAAKWPAVCAAWTGEGNTALRRAARMKPGQMTDAFLEDLERAAASVAGMAESARQLSGELVGLARSLREVRDAAQQGPGGAGRRRV